MQNYSIMWFGFDGQTYGLGFGEGRFRLPGEQIRLYGGERDVADVTDDVIGTRRVVMISAPEEEHAIDHAERMRQHFISQFQWDVIDGKIYDDKPVLRAIVEALGAELDELNKAVTEVRDKRWLDTAVGQQLDGIGEIVDRSRQLDHAIAVPVFGFLGQPNIRGFGKARFRGHDEDILSTYILEDEEYRKVLKQKVMKDVSRATAEETIRSLKFIFNAPRVILEEQGNANITVAIGRILYDNDILLANAADLLIRAGGVGLIYKAYFDYNKYFGFLGQPNAKGFGKGSFAQMF